MIKRQIVCDNKVRNYLAEYNTNDPHNPKERASLYEHFYTLKDGGRSETTKHEIIIRQKSKIVYREDLSEIFDLALYEFNDIVSDRAYPIHAIGKIGIKMLGGLIPLSNIARDE